MPLSRTGPGKTPAGLCNRPHVIQYVYFLIDIAVCDTAARREQERVPALCRDPLFSAKNFQAHQLRQLGNPFQLRYTLSESGALKDSDKRAFLHGTTVTIWGIK